jgi:hypothetical protein
VVRQDGNYEHGLVVFPGGQYSPEPATTVRYPWGSYDRSIGRADVYDPSSVSPDGRRVAFITDDPGGLDRPSRVHITNLSDLTDRVVGLTPVDGDGRGYNSWLVVAFTSTHVYIEAGGHHGYGPQLALNLNTWKYEPPPFRVLGAGPGESLWGPSQGQPGVRLVDFVTSREVMRFTGPEGDDFEVMASRGALQVIGVTADVAQPGGGAIELWVDEIGGGRSKIYQQDSVANVRARVDGDRVWIGARDGLYLYDTYHGTRKVSDIWVDPISGCA